MDAVTKLKEILEKRDIDTNALKPESTLVDIGLDSLDLVEVMLEIEEYVGQEFSSQEIMDLKTIQDVVNLINSKLK